MLNANKYPGYQIDYHGEYFTMIMMVDMEKMELLVEEVKDRLNKLGEELGVSIKLQHEIFSAPCTGYSKHGILKRVDFK